MKRPIHRHYEIKKAFSAKNGKIDFLFHFPKCLQNRRQKMENLKLRIQNPLDITKEAYVYVYCTETQKKLKRYTKGLNRANTWEDRQTDCEALLYILQKKMRAGWSPVVQRKVERFNITEAVTLSMQGIKLKASPKTFSAYSGTARFFLQALKDLRYHHYPADGIKRIHIKEALNKIAQDRKWTGKNYNKHLGYLSSIFAEMTEREYCERNLCKDIKRLPVLETGGYRVPTEEELNSIFSYLKRVHPNYYRFALFLYYTGIRPKELLALRVGDIHLDARLIRVRAEISKTRKERKVPLFPALYDSMPPLGDNPSAYLFGSTKASRYLPEETFTVGIYHIDRDTATRTWKKLIMTDLGVSCHLYSLKHRGAGDKLNAGMSREAVQMIFGHSEAKMTDIYDFALKERQFKEAMEVDLKRY